MTLSNTIIRDFPTGDGSTLTFSYSSKITAKNELGVYINGAKRTLYADYDVTNVGGAGGSVVFVVAPPNGAQLLFQRETERTQTVNFKEAGGTFSAETFERLADKQMAVSQELADMLTRTVKIAADANYDGPVLPDPQEGHAIVWEGNGFRNSTSSIDTVVADLNANAQAIANTAAAGAVAAVQNDLDALSTNVTNAEANVSNMANTVSQSLATITAQANTVNTQTNTVQTLHDTVLTTKTEVDGLKTDTVNASISAMAAAQAAEGLVDAVGNPLKFYIKQRLINIW